MKNYKHLFFDLDHTLWDFDKNAKTTLTEIYGQFSLDTKVNAAFDDFYQKYLFHNQVLWDRYHKGFITADDLKWKRMWRTLLDFKIADELLAKNISGRFLEILPTQKEVFPHTFEIRITCRGKIMCFILSPMALKKRSGANSITAGWISILHM
jgi:putative hydrolase of the HAD superfamily